MSLHITFFGPNHYFWQNARGVWFHRQNEDSTGGVGFCIPFFHVCFMWGGD